MPTPTPKPPMDFTHEPPEPSTGVYRKIALAFIAVLVVLILAVVYASLIRATIRITPLAQPVTASFLVDVAEDPVGESTVRGMVLSSTVQISDTFTLEPDDSDAEPIIGKASGLITIVNDRATSQSLVATTRFLSEDDVLFRLDEAVNVPAGGSVEARITADEEGEQGDIGPTRFTIPGLSESLQDVVYGVSESRMTGGLSYATVLSQEDLDAAEEDLKARALEQGMEELSDQNDIFPGSSYTAEVTEKASDTPPGEQTGSFNVQLTVEVTGVFYDTDGLFRVAESKLYSDIERGLEPVGIDRDELVTTIERVDLDPAMATLRVQLSGSAIPSAAHDALARGTFSRMTAEEVTAYFEDNNLAQTVEVELRPFWINRVPRSQNKIRLEIVK